METETKYEGACASPDRLGRWMQVYTGRKYWPVDPRPEDVFIEDIAHALSLLCRYTGHSDKFYSVAEHSVLMSKLVRPDIALQALMHDATEAYLGDVGRPLKVSLPEYKKIEEQNWYAIADRFMLPRQLDEEIKRIDIQICLAERRDLGMLRGNHDWEISGPAPDVKIGGWLPLAAEYIFLRRFEELNKK